MLDDLDSIPWDRLTHAYGSAEDVPDLLRALRTYTESAEGDDDEEAPLWQLFGNIWHQGTVYEATAYAVPFLIELAADPLTPDRVVILGLLADIAKGNSRDWAAKAHAAVAAGLAALIAITKEEGEARLAAAHVLALLPEHGEIVEPLLHGLLHAETYPLRRAGLLILLGRAGGPSAASFSLLETALGSGDPIQRLAAALSVARLRPQPLSAPAREAILEAIQIENLAGNFKGLPWDVGSEVDRGELYAGLDEPAREGVAEGWIVAIESGHASDHLVGSLLRLLFTFAGPQLAACDLSPLQRRAVQAMASAMKGGRRIFYGAFSQWGLPDTMRHWNDLAAGREQSQNDRTLPMLTDPANPRGELRARDAKPGQRILHRSFGLGTVLEAKRRLFSTELTVQFDEEGWKKLLL